MKIYTGRGDDGCTSFIGGQRVRKDDCRIEAYGNLDELNCAIGIAASFTDDRHVKEILLKVQNDLFTVGAELASLTFKSETPMPKVTVEHVKELEEWIDAIEPRLAIQRGFVLPGGTQSSAFLQLARAICRRAERGIMHITIDTHTEINPHLLQYMNRLSSLLYVLARLANKELSVKEQQPIYKYLEEQKAEHEHSR